MEIIKKEEQVTQIQSEFGRQLQYYESNDYVIKRIEKSILETKNSKGDYSNPIYDTFMKLSLTGNRAGGMK